MKRSDWEKSRSQERVSNSEQKEAKTDTEDPANEEQQQTEIETSDNE